MYHRTSHWGTGRKAPPPCSGQTGENFLDSIYPFHVISSNFGSAGRKAPPPQDESKNFYTGSIHFWQFPATLVFVAEPPPPTPTRMREKNVHWIYPFQAISSNFGFCGRKAPPLPPQDEGFFFTPDLSISGNFQQLWFLWQKSPPPNPPLRMREFFLYWIYPFQAISSNFGFCGRNDDDFHRTRTSTRYERLFAGNGDPSSLYFMAHEHYR